MKQTLHLTLKLPNGELASMQVSVDADDDCDHLREAMVGQLDNAIDEAFRFKDIARCELSHCVASKPQPGIFTEAKS